MDWYGNRIVDGIGLCCINIYTGIFDDLSFGICIWLVAFGFLGMGPVTIAVDSYGPVTDNAQSVYELSLIEDIPNVGKKLKKIFHSNLTLIMQKNT